jgi:lipoprotein NlpD
LKPEKTRPLSAARYDAGLRQRVWRLFGVGLLCLTLLGCSASWRAPVESRGAIPDPSVASASVRTMPARPPASPAVPRRAPAAYRVRSGDTLIGIAWEYGVDYRNVADWNDIDPPYHIYAGQTLRLRPPVAPRPATKATPPPPPTPSSTQTRPPARAAPTKSLPPSPPSRSLVWRWPARGAVASTFKPSDPLRTGIKIAGRDGSDIVAAERGKVVYSGSGLIGYGRLIIVKHNDNYLSAYGHNRELLVDEGEQVTKGQKIAAMGRANDGQALLHFEIRRNGRPVDPLRMLPKR